MEAGVNMQPASEAETTRADSLAIVALASAVLGLAALIVAYWLIVPSVVLGGAAVGMGLVARRRAGRGAQAREIAIVALSLGAVAVLFTPVTLLHTGDAERWGRDCALHPDRDENCP